MDIIIYLVLLTLSLVFIFLGYSLKGQGDVFQIVGFGFLFLLGVMVIPNTYGSLEYCTGTNITETATGYLTTDVVTIYEDFTIGFFLSVASIFGFIQVFTSRKHHGGFGEHEEE